MSRKASTLPRSLASTLMCSPKALVSSGGSAPSIPTLARRLATTGDFAADGLKDGDTAYGPDLQEAVKRFQQEAVLQVRSDVWLRVR